MFSPLGGPENSFDEHEICSPISGSDPLKFLTPKKKLNLSTSDVSSPNGDGDFLVQKIDKWDSRSSLTDLNSTRKTKTAKRALLRPNSLSLLNENVDVSCCSSQPLPKPDTYPKPVNVPSPLHKSSLFVRSFSPSASPLSVEKSLLKQIESPLGHMHLSSPAPFPSFRSSGARTEFQDCDGFATDMIESEMQDFNDSSPRVSTAITQLINAPVSSVPSVSSKTTAVPMSDDEITHSSKRSLHRCMSLSTAENVKQEERSVALKRLIPFTSTSDPKRVPPSLWPPTPCLSRKSSTLTVSDTHVVLSSHSPIKEEKSPRSMSVDTPPSSSKQKTNPSFLRSRSMSVSQFKSPPLVEQFARDEEEHLIGDNTKECCLPILKGGNQKRISVQTVCDLIDGKYSEIVEKFIIIDARYPYEYDGGHIKGAINIWNTEMLEKRLFDNPAYPTSEKRVIYIFHCEFSSKRGPNLLQHLREVDRTKNGVQNFPKLYYPEVYLLQGGYSVFYSKAKNYCDPPNYCEMHDAKYKEELKHFVRRSKSWTGPSYTAKRTCRLFSNPSSQH